MGYAPCINCCDREVGCHSKCEKYKKFRSDLDEKNRINKERKDKQSATMEYIIESKRRMARSHRSRSSVLK